mgnify:CR=1 FL=1
MMLRLWRTKLPVEPSPLCGVWHTTVVYFSTLIFSPGRCFRNTLTSWNPNQWFHLSLARYMFIFSNMSLLYSLLLCFFQGFTVAFLPAFRHRWNGELNTSQIRASLLVVLFFLPGTKRKHQNLFWKMMLILLFHKQFCSTCPLSCLTATDSIFHVLQ